MQYARAADVREALEFLREFGPETAVLAGGTDLMVELRAGRLKASRFLDISRLEDLKGIQQEGEDLHLGSGLTFTEILSSDVAAAWTPVLQKAASTIGSQQVRNMATIGGNVAHCSPCADSVPALLVHDTKVVLASANGERTISLDAFLKGPYQNDRRPDELITRFILKGWNHGFHGFQKLARRRELAVARLTLAMLADVNTDGKISVFRLALGAGTPAPRRMAQVEEFLTGKKLAEHDLWEAGRLLSQEMVGVTGTRPSTVYKEKAVQGLLVKTLYPLLGDYQREDKHMETLPEFARRLSDSIGCYYHLCDSKYFSLQKYNTNISGKMGVFAYVVEMVRTNRFRIDVWEDKAERAEVAHLADGRKPTLMFGRPGVYFFVGRGSSGEDYRRTVTALRAVCALQ